MSAVCACWICDPLFEKRSIKADSKDDRLRQGDESIVIKRQSSLETIMKRQE